MRNANKSPKIPHSATVKKMKKLIQNPHVELDHCQKLIASRGSPFAHACQVWFYSMTDRQTDRQTERSHNLRLVGGDNYFYNNCL